MKMKDFPEMLPMLNHCPNKKCRWHIPDRTKNIKWYKLHGYYYSAQHGRIARFRCLGCGRTFSLRSNMVNRYLHYDDIEIDEIGFSYLAGASLCEMARERGISIGMVRTRLKRFFDFYDEKAC